MPCPIWHTGHMWPTLTKKEKRLFKIVKNNTNSWIGGTKQNMLITSDIKITNVLT